MEKLSKDRALDKLTVGFGVSFLIVSVINGLLIVAKETYAPLKDLMKSLLGHHWTTHGIFVVVLFIILGYILSRADMGRKIDAGKISGMVIAGTVLGGLIIVGFFFKHFYD